MPPRASRSAAEHGLILMEMGELELAFCGLQNHLRDASNLQQTAADVQTKVASAELDDLEAKVEEARRVQRAAERTYHAHLAVLARSLSSMEVEQIGATQSHAPHDAPHGIAELSDLQSAVGALEHLLDAELGAPSPPGPISLVPDQLCALLLEDALRPVLDPCNPRSLDDQGRTVVARAVRALGRRAGSVATAMRELGALHAVLESEIQQMELQAPGVPAAGAGG
ncbi:hypothetical protein KFE25_010032 [Diacronema lutheri]|uniref:Uncharacterized protein n=1 Tax=Diacronema lutheri TaxID=2081491 RepID=A0A8J6C9K7_DIALT|nr:hypothetical protein KFE25_010032 [Diacronema lutheri]